MYKCYKKFYHKVLLSIGSLAVLFMVNDLLKGKLSNKLIISINRHCFDTYASFAIGKRPPNDAC